MSKQTYRKRKEQFELQLKRQNKILGYIGFLRLVVALLTIYFFIIAIRQLPMFYIISSLFTILFFTLVSYHKNQSDKKRILQQLILLNETELNCLDHAFSANESGSEYIQADHPWSYDLDLFGDGSLYQYLNRTSTHEGSNKLAAYLKTVPGQMSDIKKRQTILKELAPEIDLRQLFTARARVIEKQAEEVNQLLSWVRQPAYIKKFPVLKYISILMSILSGAVIIAGFFKLDNFQFLLPILFINWFILSFFLVKTNRYQVQVSKKHSFLTTYAELLEIISRKEFTDPSLQGMKKLSVEGCSAIKRLSLLLNIFDQRLNLLMGLLLNSLFLFDFHLIRLLSGWTTKHSEDLEGWLGAISEMDALFSLSGFVYNHPEFSFPELSADVRGFKGINLGHPMISGAKRVSNSIEIDKEKVVLITGANMAGKSTFLRSVGINMVLSYAGCPVCAEHFITGPYALFSSMRTADSLKDEESYFLAEIKRLKRIVDQMEEGKPMLILLDEVLKGTNTTDKQKGSRGLIEKSVGQDILCFIATHDLALGDMQEKFKGKVINYCFESYISGLELSFDYKIQPGIAKNMNASFLMKKMGIVD